MTGKLIVDALGMNLVCTKKGQKVQATSAKGEIICPDPVEYCNDDFPACPKHCSG